MSNFGYAERGPLYEQLSLGRWVEMLEGEDPDDRAVREAHGIGYGEPCDASVVCRNGCGLNYPDISAGKIRRCEANGERRRRDGLPVPGLRARIVYG